MDLYGRLEELQGMTRLLIDDVGRLQGELGAGVPDPADVQQTNRRFYIRAVVSLVEACAEHRRLLLESGQPEILAADDVSQPAQRLRWRIVHRSQGAQHVGIGPTVEPE
jgi:hypothetical protein